MRMVVVVQLELIDQPVLNCMDAKLLSYFLKKVTSKKATLKKFNQKFKKFNQK
jgi:hypothetical protein